MAPNVLGHFEVLYEVGYEDTENEKVRFPNLTPNSPEHLPPDDVFQSTTHELNEGIFQYYLVFLSLRPYGSFLLWNDGNTSRSG
jgi:hypothetical protein